MWKQKLYEMELFQKIAPDNKTLFIRVPGGWVYSDLDGCCFVPFDNEFEKRYSGPDSTV